MEEVVRVNRFSRGVSRTYLDAEPRTVDLHGGDAVRVLSVLGSWVGVRRPFHLSVFLAAPRVVLPQDPSTNASSHWRAVAAAG